MKQYVDYCPRCPRPPKRNAEGRQIGNEPPDPSKCHYCTPEKFTEYLCQFVEAERDIEQLKKKIKKYEQGILWYRSKSKEFYTEIKKHCGKGDVRVIALCEVAVVLDWAGDNLLIRSAPLERL